MHSSHSPQSQQPSLEQSQDADIVDLGALFGTLWRGKFWIALTTLIAILIGGYYAYVAATPLFRSTAVVILETDQQQLLDLQSVVGGLSGDTTEVNSEVEVLRARTLMEKVVDRLDLVNDPEFNGSLREPGRISVLKDQVKSWIGIVETVVELPEEEQAARTRDSVVTNLLDAVSVRNVPLSLVFQVTVETESATKSALIADTIVELYILNQIEVKFEATEQATIWLSERVAELQVTLEQAEASVSEFSGSTDLVSVEGLQALERQIKDFRDRIDVATANRAELEAKLTALLAADSREASAALADDSQLSGLLSRAQNNESFFTTFDNRLELVISRLNVELTRADQQLVALNTSEDALSAELDQQGEDLITLQQLTREAEATRVLYEYFLTRFNETSALQGIQQADSRILSNAVIPNSASEPRRSLILAMSGMLGMIIGVGIILFLEARRTGFRTVQRLEQATGLTVLGQIPRIPVASRTQVTEYLKNKPMSATAEAVRNLRTSLTLSHIDSAPKIIVVTSSIPGEGKTTTSIALAQNYVGLNKKVLLIEGDIRRRTLNKYFPKMPPSGVLSVISGEKSLSEAVFHDQNLGLDILGGQKTNTSAADIFSSNAFRSFIATARDDYDIVIIDTPPILLVSDAIIISELADAVIYSVRWDHTTEAEVREGLRVLNNAEQKITGLVLSRINGRKMRQYGYGSQSGAYSRYGERYYRS